MRYSTASGSLRRVELRLLLGALGFRTYPAIYYPEEGALEVFLSPTSSNVSTDRDGCTSRPLVALYDRQQTFHDVPGS